jgi:transketolase
MAVLLFGHLRWDTEHPENPNNDHLIFSKGHASPLLYAMLKAVGIVSDAELLSYRRLGSRLQGHPVPTLPGIETATGSLGQGLPIGVGLALSGKYLERGAYHVWVLVGDSEMSEGSIWEAFDHARHYKLGNLTAILDMNRLGQRGETPLGWNSAAYAARARSFGWKPIEVDGHDASAITRAYREALLEPDVPTLVIGRTVKGKGVSLLEDKDGWHGKALDERQCAKAIEELGRFSEQVVHPHEPPVRPRHEGGQAVASPRQPRLPVYERSSTVATRKAYGEALKALGDARSDVVVLDGEVGNSTFAEDFAKAHPDRFFEMYISEQQMVAAAVGLGVRGWVPFASSFAAFLSRAYDFIRMAAVSMASVKLCGSHAGVSIGEDGPSQMGLEDLAMMRAVHGSTVLYPSCANQTAKLVAQMADTEGVVYLRTTREKTPVLYDASETFAPGGSKILRQSPADAATIVAAGVTVHEALEAYEQLRARGVSLRVMDAYSVKPIDATTLRACVRATHGNVVVVEDHWPEGGLGDAVRTSFDTPEYEPIHLRHLAVRRMPGSGKPAELLHAAEIDAEAIVRASLSLLAPRPRQRDVRRPRCFLCASPAAWRIGIGGEDEPMTEEDACELHARGHRRLAQLLPPWPMDERGDRT